MLVKPAPGLKVPVEGRPKGYITGPDPVKVPDTAYYLRLVADGSLVEVSPVEPKGRKGSERSDDK